MFNLGGLAQACAVLTHVDVFHFSNQVLMYEMETSRVIGWMMSVTDERKMLVR